ncbi:Na+/H+ antiporter subunit E [Verrucomicrobiota bacterium]
MKKIGMFVLLFLVWVLLTCSFHVQDIAAGLIVALLATLVMREMSVRKIPLWIVPVRLFWLIVYSVVLAYYIIKANFDVAYRVLHPAMPISPGIVKVRTSLKTASAITALSNSITLTPGTLTVSATNDGTLYVHWINVKTSDIEEATKCIVSRFEWFIKRIFE